MIHAMCDKVMESLMEKLELEIPPFKLVRRVQFSTMIHESESTLLVEGKDVDGLNYSLFTNVSVSFTSTTYHKEIKKEPFIVIFIALILSLQFQNWEKKLKSHFIFKDSSTSLP